MAWHHGCPSTGACNPFSGSPSPRRSRWRSSGDDLEQLEENVRFAREFTPMTAEELDATVAAAGPYARQLMYYKP